MNMLVRSLVGDDTNGIDTAKARRLQLQRHIRANLADPQLSPTRIADALHVSRRTLYAALSPDEDGVAAEIRRQRLGGWCRSVFAVDSCDGGRGLGRSERPV